jgi:kynureninase
MVPCKYEFGPGNASGCFILKKHHNNAKCSLQAGYKTKNAVSNGTNFDPVHGADGWQISNLPILSLCTIWPQSKCLMK